MFFSASRFSSIFFCRSMARSTVSIGPNDFLSGARCARQASIRALAAASVALSGVTLGLVDLLGAFTGADIPAWFDPCVPRLDCFNRSSSASFSGAKDGSVISHILFQGFIPGYGIRTDPDGMRGRHFCRVLVSGWRTVPTVKFGA